MSAFDGKISIREIERKVFEISSTQADVWVRALLLRSAPQADVVGLDPSSWAQKSLLEISCRAEKVGGDYLLSGSFKGTVPAGCSRCGDPFMVDRVSDFRVLLVPGTDPDKDVSDDPDYVFFYSDDIDLIEILSEQIIVLEPVAEHPAQKDDGSCVLCHKNPKFLSEIPEDFVGNSAFSKLKGLKLKK